MQAFKNAQSAKEVHAHIDMGRLSYPWRSSNVTSRERGKGTPKTQLLCAMLPELSMQVFCISTLVCLRVFVSKSIRHCQMSSIRTCSKRFVPISRFSSALPGQAQFQSTEGGCKGRGTLRELVPKTRCIVAAHFQWRLIDYEHDDQSSNNHLWCSPSKLIPRSLVQARPVDSDSRCYSARPPNPRYCVSALLRWFELSNWVVLWPLSELIWNQGGFQLVALIY